MISIFNHHKYGVALRLSCLLLITAALVFVPFAESMADICDSDHCDDGCETCDDCLNCLPTIHMAPADITGFSELRPRVLWSLSLPPVASEFALPMSIDHPPQNS